MCGSLGLAPARALALVCVLLAAASCGDRDDARVPRLEEDLFVPPPAPIDAAPAVPLDRATFRVVARDVRWEDDGVRVSAARLATTIAIDGDARALTILPTRITLEAPGRSRTAGTISGRLTTRLDGALGGQALVRVGASTVTVTAEGEAGGPWRATLRLDPMALADAHALEASIPPHGFARGSLLLSRADGVLRARSAGLALTTDRSELRLSGGVLRDARGGWAFDSVRLVLDPVHPEDWRAWLGSAPPLDAPLRGTLLAHGSGAGGITVDGSVVTQDTLGSRLAADVAGTLWLRPSPRLDLVVASRGLRLAGTGPLDLDVRLSGGADSLAIAGAVRFTPGDTVGDELRRVLDALPAGIASRIERSELRVDADVLRDADGARVRGEALVVDSADDAWLALGGYAPLDGAGPLDVTAHADSVPLALLRMPAEVRNLDGYARVRARASGRLDFAAVDADLELIGVRFDVPEYGTGVDSLVAHARLEGDRVEFTDVRAFRAGGSLSLLGGVDLGAPVDLRDPASALEDATVDAVLLLDTVTIVDIDSARAVVAGRLAIAGPLERPHVGGTVHVIDGHVFEGKLAPRPPIDPDDPPYLELAATAPWPEGRLSALAASRAATDEPTPPPLTADVTVAVRPDFRVIDEDSDLGVLGALRVVVDDRRAWALGDARIVDGFYAYYGELFQLVGGAFAVDGTATRLAMSGVLREADRPLGRGQGGHDGLDRRDPPLGIFGYSTPATVLELLRYRSAVPATQPELASLLLFDTPLQTLDGAQNELLWRGDEPEDMVGHRSAIQGSGLAWSFLADELYDYVPLDVGYLRAGTIRIGSRYPGWIMLGTQLEAGLHVGSRLTARAIHVVGGAAWPGVGLRYALRRQSIEPARRHIELFNEPRFVARLGTSGPRADFDARRRTGLRVRWRWEY